MTDQDLRSQRNQAQRGVALISVLLLLVLISALVVAVLYKVNTEQRLQKTDSQNNQAYYGAEAGMEKVMADLDALYAQKAAPLCADITNLQTLQPAGLGVTYANYRIDIPETSPANICTTPPQRIQNISSGMTSGMKAYIVPLTVTVTADRPGGEQASMIRQVEVALIPIFQFGVFSDSDLSFFPGPEFDFNGRVHTNGNLFLASEDSVGLTFHTFIRAAKDVVRDQLANGAGTVAQGRTEPVNIPTAPNGCPSSNCRNLRVSPNEGSSIGGPSTTYGGTGTPNTSWDSLSKSTYNSMIMSGSTGAKPLHLEFVQAGVDPIEIIRRAPLAELATSNIGQSRRYHLAQIRVLLSDDPEELPGGAGDANNIRLANVQTNAAAGNPDYSNGVPVLGTGNAPSGQPFKTYFAEASTTVQDASAWTNSSTQYCLPSDVTTLPFTPPFGDVGFTLRNYRAKPLPAVVDPTAPLPASALYAPYFSVAAPISPNPACFKTATQANAELPIQTADAPAGAGTSWNLIDGYLRVEIRQANGAYIPVTKEWLELGFARGLAPPKTGALNTINPNAILIIQQPADRNGNGTLDLRQDGATSTTTQRVYSAPSPYTCVLTRTPPQYRDSQNKWKNCPYTDISTTTRGIEKPAEVRTDPGLPNGYYGDGNNPSVTRYNWYPINFYDAREGEMRDNSDATDCKVGGIINVVEIDVKNLRTWLSSDAGSGKLVDQESQNGYVLYFSDRRGMLPNPNAGSVKNGEYGFEDVINPSSGSGGAPNGGNPDAGEDVDANGQLDVWGKENLGFGFGAANSRDPFNKHVDCMTMARRNWISGARHGVRLVNGSLGNLPKRWDTGGGGFTLVSENPAYVLGDYNATGGFAGDHASAAVIADTVTLLSNDWTDLESFTSPTDPAGRDASTTYFRLAIASGKNKNFPIPAWGGTPTVPNDYGTDGGVHNFLRYLESWGGDTSYYMGSMVSLYYSQYATGVYKCCNTVYTPPTRNYVFDLDFNDLTKMPPGTPRLRDVVDVGFQQVF